MSEWNWEAERTRIDQAVKRWKPVDGSPYFDYMRNARHYNYMVTIRHHMNTHDLGPGTTPTCFDEDVRSLTPLPRQLSLGHCLSGYFVKISDEYKRAYLAEVSRVCAPAVPVKDLQLLVGQYVLWQPPEELQEPRVTKRKREE